MWCFIYSRKLFAKKLEFFGVKGVSQFILEENFQFNGSKVLLTQGFISKNKRTLRICQKFRAGGFALCYQSKPVRFALFPLFWPSW